MKNSYKYNGKGGSLSLSGGLLILMVISCLMPALLEARKFRGSEVATTGSSNRLFLKFPNRSGVTTDDVQHWVMKKLMSSGIRLTAPRNHATSLRLTWSSFQRAHHSVWWCHQKRWLRHTGLTPRQSAR